jgi:hypothetical protein
MNTASSLPAAHNLAGYATRLSKVTMHYVNYENTIVKHHGVELVGLTYLQFINPADMNCVGDIRTLHNALRCVACYSVQLLAQDLQNGLEEVEVRREWGEVVHKKRKKHLDKGVKCKCRTTTDKNGIGKGTQPAKKHKTGKNVARHLPPKDRAIIEDDEDEDEDKDSRTEAT